MTANWHPDPSGRHELRYWDGQRWTEHVSNGGNVATDPLEGGGQPAEAQLVEAEQEQAQQVELGKAAAEQPQTGPVDVPGDGASEGAAAAPSAAAASPGPMAAGAPPAYRPDDVPQEAFAGISGELIDGRYSEVSGGGATLQNKKMLRVRIDQPFMAKQGAMVAYQGNVNFAYQGGGAAKFLKKALTGEGLSLMRVEGQGDVFLADEAHDVHILHLNNSGLSVNGKNVLAFSGSLEWNVERVKGGGIAAGGLFNTTLRGTGWVAISTDGEPVVLNAQEAPTFADSDALVAWSLQLQTSIRSTFTAGALIGRGSGEAFQVAFQGPGFVIVQPSEGASVPPHTH